MEYNDARETAEEKIAEYGTPCKLIFLGNQVYDVKTNSYVYPDKKEYDGNCLITHFEANLIDGTVIKSGDVNILSVFDEAVSDIDPGLSYLEVLNSVGVVIGKYQIVTPGKVAPDGESVILHKLHCRKQ